MFKIISNWNCSTSECWMFENGIEQKRNQSSFRPSRLRAFFMAIFSLLFGWWRRMLCQKCSFYSIQKCHYFCLICRLTCAHRFQIYKLKTLPKKCERINNCMAHHIWGWNECQRSNWMDAKQSKNKSFIECDILAFDWICPSMPYAMPAKRRQLI